MTLNFQNSTLQIFLSLYHGSLISTFLYDYVIRHSVWMFQNGFDKNYVANIALGVLCVS